MAKEKETKKVIGNSFAERIEKISAKIEALKLTNEKVQIAESIAGNFIIPEDFFSGVEELEAKFQFCFPAISKSNSLYLAASFEVQNLQFTTLFPKNEVLNKVDRNASYKVAFDLLTKECKAIGKELKGKSVAIKRGDYVQPRSGYLVTLVLPEDAK